MRYGILILPDARWASAKRCWTLAEEWGFDHAWTYDHLTWRSLRDKPWFGAMPTLTAAACVTSTIRLGTMVASPNFRHPVPFAKELMTLDDISGGRLILGFGAGADGFDATATRSSAWTPKERQVRFEEFVTALDALLQQPKSNFRGTFYLANEARAIPGCIQQPRIPFALAANGPKGMRVVARFAQSWIAIDSRGAGRAELAKLKAACEAVGRDFSSLERIALIGHVRKPLDSVSAFEDAAEDLEALGFTDMVVHWPRQEAPFKAAYSILEKIAADCLAKNNGALSHKP